MTIRNKNEVVYFSTMIICGLDECGRGPLAGPIMAAAVVLSQPLKNLKDSKQLSAKKRQYLYRRIIKTATAVKIESISVQQINNRGIGWANKEIFKRLIRKIEADKYIVDGNLKIPKAVSIIKADTKIPEVMAASIVAKVTRDKLMRELAKDYPRFGWHSNMGYGTKYHLSALQEIGPTKHHRSAFVTTALRNRG